MIEVTGNTVIDALLDVDALRICDDARRDTRPANSII